MTGNLRVCGTLHGIRFVVVRGPPDDEDIDDAVAASGKDGARGALLFAPPVLRPPPPNAAQREKLFNARGIRGVRTAVVSDSCGFRLVLKLLGWLGTPVAAFSQDRLDDAVAYLGVPDDVKPALIAHARELVASLPAPATHAHPA